MFHFKKFLYFLTILIVLSLTINFFIKNSSKQPPTVDNTSNVEVVQDVESRSTQFIVTTLSPESYTTINEGDNGQPINKHVKDQGSQDNNWDSYSKIIINVPANPGAHIIQLGCEQLTEIKPDVPISVSVADSDDLIVSVDISGVISGSATKPGDTWTFSDVAEQLSAGEYIVTVTATYSDGSTETQSKSFSVLLDELSPSDGCNVNKTIALISYSVHLSGDPVRSSPFGQVPVEWRQRCVFNGSFVGSTLSSGLPNYRRIYNYSGQKFLYYTDDGSSISDNCIEEAQINASSRNLFPHLSSDWEDCEGVFNDSKCKFPLF